MDERTPEIPVAGEPEQGEPAAKYSWHAVPVAPAAAEPQPWAAGGTDEPELPPIPASAAWTPAVWEPAAPVPASATVAAELTEQPVPAAPESSPAVADEAPAPRTSLLKQELSFRRKPKAAKAPKAGKAEKPSLLKTELSVGRRPKAKKPTADSTSALRKPISFGRKPRSDRPKAAKSGSFLKQEISFGRKRATGVKAAQAPKAVKSSKGVKPAPVTMHKKLVGLKIGASQLAAARVLNNGSAQLVQLARGPLEPGIVVGGELRDPDKLAEALRDFFATNKLPKRGVRLGLASNRIGVRVFELEGIDDPRQLANAIRFRAQEALPIPLDEAVLDYQVLDERVDHDGRTVRRILLVVAYRELIDRYVGACRKAGIQLVGIDLEAFALLRALSAPNDASDPPAEAAVVAVSIGSDRTTFAVSNGRVCEFTRVLEWGGISLDVAVARTLDVAPSEAEPIKRALGLEGGETPAGLSAEQVAAARDAIAREVQAFARELVSSLQFYQNQPGSLGIAEIAVTGGTAHLNGLSEQLQKLIGVPVRVGDPLEHVRVGKRLKGDAQLGSLTVAIGLGVER